jgi:hypothetical protein
VSSEGSCEMLKKKTHQNKNHDAQNMLMVKLKDLFTSPIRRGFAHGFVNYKNGALDSKPQVIKLTSHLSMVKTHPNMKIDLKVC